MKTCAVILQTFLASVESTQCILFGGSFQENMMLLSAVVTVKCKCWEMLVIDRFLTWFAFAVDCVVFRPDINNRNGWLGVKHQVTYCVVSGTVIQICACATNWCKREGFKVLSNLLPLGARKWSYIRTRHSLWTSTWVLLINNYHTLRKRREKKKKGRTQIKVINM